MCNCFNKYGSKHDKKKNFVKIVVCESFKLEKSVCLKHQHLKTWLFFGNQILISGNGKDHFIFQTLTYYVSKEIPDQISSQKLNG